MVFIDIHSAMMDISRYQNRNSHLNSGNEKWTSFIIKYIDITNYTVYIIIIQIPNIYVTLYIIWKSDNSIINSNRIHRWVLIIDYTNIYKGIWIVLPYNNDNRQSTTPENGDANVLKSARDDLIASHG